MDRPPLDSIFSADVVEIAPPAFAMGDGLSDAQHAMRRQGLGASEVAAVLGLDARRTPWEVWAAKRGLLTRGPQTEPQAWGHLLEPVVADRYISDLRREVPGWGRVVGTLARTDAPWALATPDRVIETVDGDAWLLEVKTRSAWSAGEWGEPGTDDIPRAVLVQAHWQMLVTRLTRVDVAVLLGGSDYRVYSVTADAGLHADLLSEARAWWHDHMVSGIEPPIGGTEAAAWVGRHFPQATRDEVLVADAATTAQLHRLAQVKEELAQLKADERDLQTGLKAIIGDAKGLRTEDGLRATWANVRGRSEVDWETIARACGAPSALIQKHTTVGAGHRAFRLTTPKGEAA